MAQRESAYVSLAEQVYGGEAPNRYVPSITVDLRAFFPPGLGHEARTEELIRQAADDAIRQLRKENG